MSEPKFSFSHIYLMACAHYHVHLKCPYLKCSHLKTCLRVLYMDEKTSLWVRTPAGPAYAHTSEEYRQQSMVAETQRKEIREMDEISFTHLSDKDTVVIELGLQHLLIERFCIELIAGPSFNWICQVSHYHIELLLPFLQLSPLSLFHQQLISIIYSTHTHTHKIKCYLIALAYNQKKNQCSEK